MLLLANGLLTFYLLNLAVSGLPVVAGGTLPDFSLAPVRMHNSRSSVRVGGIT